MLDGNRFENNVCNHRSMDILSCLVAFDRTVLSGFCRTVFCAKLCQGDSVLSHYIIPLLSCHSHLGNF